MKKTPTSRWKLPTQMAFTLSATMILAPAQETGPERGEHNIRRTAPVPRAMPRPNRRPGNQHPDGSNTPIEIPAEPRTVDGSGNNLENPTWGSAEHPFIRLFENGYLDGVETPIDDQPSARAVSNAIAAQVEFIPNRKGASDFLWQWGQFIDHDIVETPTIDPAEAFDIKVPAGDPYFDPTGTGTATIGLNRSLYEVTDGVRQQVNAITSYIDGSMVYGSDDERAFALRRLDGSGKLKVTESEHGDLLPYNDRGFANAPAASPNFFLAGDVRANEQVALTAMHTLFMREHNYWADRYVERNPQAMDEEIYQFARMIVAAEIQAITYREFLPLLLGRDAIHPYRGYQENVRADISNEFGAAAFRIGHSMLSPTLLRLDALGNEIEAGHLSLAGAFFNPTLTEDEGIESILRGLAKQQCQELDEKIIDDVRNFLFGPPGAGGFDLAALNLQRGRDHGVPSYNDVRRKLGLSPVSDFSDITNDQDVVNALASTYDSPEQLDLWITSLCEEPVRESMVGRTYQHILVDQFTRLRDGDRFYYEDALPESMVQMVNEQSLARIIRRNTDIGEELPDNVFLTNPAPPRPKSRRSLPRRNEIRRDQQKRSKTSLQKSR